MVRWWLVVATVLPATLLAWLAGRVMRIMAPHWGWLDRPTLRKDHAQPIPLGGGLAIWLAVVLPLLGLEALAWWQPAWLAQLVPAPLALHVAGIRAATPGLALFLGLATILLLLGLADDRWRLPWQVRLACQFMVAIVAVTAGGWKLTLYLPLTSITWVLSVLWIVALINSFNMLDNMDGLSSGTAAIVCATLMAILLSGPHPNSPHPQWFWAGVLGLLLGGNLGFLFHNAEPARLFMGDAGSYFLGFCLAVVTLQASYASYQPGTWHATLAPLLVMAVPFYDMISVIGIRLREGRSPFQADRRHLSHRFVALGLTRGRAVTTIHLLTATCGFAAILLHRVDGVGAWLLVILVLSVLATIAMLESAGAKTT